MQRRKHRQQLIQCMTSVASLLSADGSLQGLSWAPLCKAAMLCAGGKQQGLC